MHPNATLLCYLVALSNLSLLQSPGPAVACHLTQSPNSTGESYSYIVKQLCKEISVLFSK